ncbi:hypothetical protein BP5796_00982 [Coleophoma crateriformis]|uniref:BTB domain-containing protein n=1 Tax=Coleophoma crateriformis TaxID=565419 RepID=A0A3D8T9G5_9HELO|nr:hypothetical protein BP5796_00982 [Coleophoma crateriformis]
MSWDPNFIEVDPSGDLTVKVVEYNYDMTSADGGHPILQKAQLKAQLKVRRQVLVESSKVFKAMLTGSFAEATRDEIVLEEDTVASMELWFLAIHGKLETISSDFPIKEIWEAIAVGQKYNLAARNLAPCFCLYHGDNIGIEQLNAIRGSVRRKIIGGLFNPLMDMRNCKCQKNKDAVCSYLDGIFLTNIWPLENNGRKSNEEIIDGPGIVDWKCKLEAGACSACTSKLEGQHIKSLCGEVGDYWQGLCLDCMNITRPKTGNIHSDYWLHNELRKWDSKCRITHGRNTWYLSFMGRAETMSSYLHEQILNR